MNTICVKKQNNYYDIFSADGWENHTRFHYNKGKLTFITGRTLTKEEFHAFKQEIKNVSVTSKK